MSRRRKRRRGRGKKGAGRFLRRMVVVVNLVLLAVGGVWYLQQPEERQAEIRMLVKNSLDRDKEVRITDIAMDIYTLYFSDQFVASSYTGSAESVYGGYPATTSFAYTVRVLHNEGFTVGYSDVKQNPVWVGYRVFDADLSSETPERPSSFSMDSRTIARVRPEDYTGSGFARGHMAPNYSMVTRYGLEAQQQSFLMSNIAPQRQHLNNGPWSTLERKIARNYSARYGDVWVITGPIFGEPPRRMSSGVPIPEAFYKILVNEHEGRLRVKAYIMDQDVLMDDPLDPFLTSVREVERRTGFNFFPELEETLQETVETRTAARSW